VSTQAPPAPKTAPPAPTTDIPHTLEKLGNVRKVIARRLTEAKQTVPHIYLTLDVELDALLKLRADLNKALEPRGIKVSVNDLVIKALALGLRQVPKCNVSFAGDHLLVYDRADISVAVAAPSGLITPIIVGADTKSVSVIATEMKALAEKARAGKLQPYEYQGGTASLSNLGMFGIKQFDAVINPPQGMILAVGAGEKRAVVKGDALAIATVMTITGSFDHRAIDGADGAALMGAVKALIESPLGLVA
jgi:pyruvate dehydrogenase E2 component (dihydrolipoamide acetyltransferase)